MQIKLEHGKIQSNYGFVEDTARGLCLTGVQLFSEINIYIQVSSGA